MNVEGDDAAAGSAVFFVSVGDVVHLGRARAGTVAYGVGAIEAKAQVLVGATCSDLSLPIDNCAGAWDFDLFPTRLLHITECPRHGGVDTLKEPYGP